MSLITTIETDAEALWAKVTGKVTAEAKAAENAAIVLYKDLIASAVAHGPEYVADLKADAMAAVEAAALMPGTGLEKAAAALASVIAAFKAKDLPIIENDIKGAVEAAYASFKQSQAGITANA